MKILQFLTLFLVFAIPLYPLQLDTRIIFVIAGFSLLLYRVFIKNFTQDLQEKNLVTIFFLLFLGALTLSTIFSIDRERSLFYLLLYFSCFVIFTSIRSIFPTQKSKILLVTCYLLPVTILSAISLYNTVIINYVNREPIGTSFMWIYFGHNHLSALLIFAVPLSIFLLKTRPLPIHSTFYILHSTFLLTALFFTFGLTSIVALAASGIVTSLLFWETSHIKKTAAGLTILVAFGAFFFGTTNFSSNFDVGKNIKSSFKGRIIYWQNALNNFKKSPLLGTGLNTFRYFNPVKKNRLPSLFTHNFFLQMLTDAGILGFVTSLGLITSLLIVCYERIRNLKLEIRNSQSAFAIALWAGLLASTLNALFDLDWQLPYIFMLFWIFASLQTYEKNNLLKK